MLAVKHGSYKYPMFDRQELDILKSKGYQFDHAWQVVDLFERKISEFFGAPYGVATDSCTHALELCLHLLDDTKTAVYLPLHTYLSIPMMLDKISQDWQFRTMHWQEQYQLDPLPIIDGARLWRPGSYQSGTMLALSFQYKKHVPIGRGGMILTDDRDCYVRLQRMVRDGRDRRLLWKDDDITDLGYHYYMTPEDAARGIILFDERKDVTPVSYGWQDYRPLNDFSYFKNR